jgi:hypothetical protein
MPPDASTLTAIIASPQLMRTCHDPNPRKGTETAEAFSNLSKERKTCHDPNPRKGTRVEIESDRLSYRAVVQNKQDCPEDSGHWELRESDSEALLQSRSCSLYLKDVLCSRPGSVGNYRENI